MQFPPILEAFQMKLDQTNTHENCPAPTFSSDQADGVGSREDVPLFTLEKGVAEEEMGLRRRLNMALVPPRKVQ